MIEMEYKHLKFEIKALNDQGEFEGYAAVKGNVDAYGDIIENGAFKRTIRSKRQVPILFMHDPSKPVGLSTYMQEDDKGLYTRGRLDLTTENGRMMYSGLQMGYIDCLSIGYTVVQDDINKRGNRLLKEIKLLEYSLITKGFAANELAMVSGFKSTYEYDRRIQQLEDELKKRKSEEDGEEVPMDSEKMRKRMDDMEDRMDDLEESIKACMDQMKLANPQKSTWPTPDSDYSTLEMKKVSGASDLPLADRGHDWNGPEAKKRIFEWAGNGDGFDPKKAERAFFYVDSSKPEEKGSYKLPFADVVDGKLVAIPRAISAVEGAINGARGTGVDIPDADKSAIMRKVESYKKRMGEEPKANQDVLAALHELNKFLRGEE